MTVRAGHIEYSMRAWWIHLRLILFNARWCLLASGVVMIVWGLALVLSSSASYESVFRALRQPMSVQAQGLAAVILGTTGIVASPLFRSRLFPLVAFVMGCFWLWPAVAFTIELGVATHFVYFAFSGFNVWALYLWFRRLYEVRGKR